MSKPINWIKLSSRRTDQLIKLLKKAYKNGSLFFVLFFRESEEAKGMNKN